MRFRRNYYGLLDCFSSWGQVDGFAFPPLIFPSDHAVAPQTRSGIWTSSLPQQRFRLSSAISEGKRHYDQPTTRPLGVLESIRKRKTTPKTQESETVGALEEILDFGTRYVYQTPVEVVHASTQ